MDAVCHVKRTVCVRCSGALVTFPPTSEEVLTRVLVQIREKFEASERDKQAMLAMTKERAGISGKKDDEELEYVAYVPLPEEREIELRVAAKKKSELMAKYATDDLLKQQEEAKQLLNIDQ